MLNTGIFVIQKEFGRAMCICKLFKFDYALNQLSVLPDESGFFVLLLNLFTTTNHYDHGFGRASGSIWKRGWDIDGHVIDRIKACG